ncbi:MAG: PEGA domain-containing protein [bacterium]|nr:PEGA domain-containing protein [bacterium]
MIFRKSLIFLLLLPSAGNLFSMAGRIKKPDEVRLVRLQDRSYRTLAVQPFYNLTGNDYHAYIGRSIQKFLAEGFDVLKNIAVSTDDFLIPENFRTNRKTIFSYGTNFLRNIVLLQSDEVYRKFVSFPEADKPEKFARSLPCDYLVYGSYRFAGNETEKYKVEYRIYNTIQDRDILIRKLSLSSKTLEADVRDMGQDIVRFFKRKQTGTMKVNTQITNFEILINGKLANNKVFFHDLPAGSHQIGFKTLIQTFRTNLVIQPGKTNEVSFAPGPPVHSTLIIRSEPEHSDVFLNVMGLGRTPLLWTNLEPGPYRLQVSYSNYFTWYRNIILHPGTNQHAVTLEKIKSAEELRREYVRNKQVMYVTLGLGSLSLLTAYFTYAASDNEYDRYLATGDRSSYENSNQYLTAALISGLVGLGSLTVSFVYFLKVLNYDDVNIGLREKEGQEPVYAFQRANHYLLMNIRF